MESRTGLACPGAQILRSDKMRLLPKGPIRDWEIHAIQNLTAWLDRELTGKDPYCTVGSINLFSYSTKPKFNLFTESPYYNLKV